ncbi:hypothetical protein [Methylopila sp. M107]|uniref:hypothetical protein n=1 Tax=Methylopila sp. M107 TaxID=1101190 RepID=UPI0003826E36|nr:hypothetical protein [Methylopila sp. M107]
MSDDPKLVTLPPAASRALRAFAERIGQDPQALAAEAIERFIAEEEPIADRVLQSLEDMRQGRFLTPEQVMERLEAKIDQASRKIA